MKVLTSRQQQNLKGLLLTLKRGFPQQELELEALGFKSPNAVEEHLKALVKKGLSMVPGASRHQTFWFVRKVSKGGLWLFIVAFDRKG